MQERRALIANDPFYQEVFETLVKEYEIPQHRLGILEERKEDRAPYLSALRDLAQEGTEELWAETEKLLVRRSLNMYRPYEIPVPVRVLMTKLAGKYSLPSIRKMLNLPWDLTGEKIVKETASAIAYVLGKNNSILPLKDLDEYGKEMYVEFAETERERLLLATTMLNPEVRSLLDSTHPLDHLLRRYFSDGGITPYLFELGFDDFNLDSVTNTHFYKFATEGDRRSGMGKWIRRVLFREWINSESRSINFHGVDISQALSEIGWLSFSGEFATPSDKDAAVERELRHFLTYLQLEDLLFFLNNNSFHENDIAEVFSLTNTVGHRISLKKELLGPEGAKRMEEFLENGLFVFNIDPIKYFHNVQKSSLPSSFYGFINTLSSTRERTWSSVGDQTSAPLIDRIAIVLNQKTSSSRKIYDTGVAVCEHLLLTKTSEIDPRTFLSSLSVSPVYQAHSRYAQIVEEQKPLLNPRKFEIKPKF